MKTAKLLAGSIAACGWMVLVSACSIMSPQPDNTKFFVLTSTAGASAGSTTPAAAASDTSTLGIGVGPIKLPQYLRRPEVVTRTSPSELTLSDTERWAEPLDSAFARVLSENLSQLLGTQQVVTFPWYNSGQIDYAVQVNVMRFETDPKGKPELVAQWSIRGGLSGKVLIARESDVIGSAETANPSPSAGLSQVLGSLSQEIASQIVQLKAQRKRG
jgi:uncharacterized lipoprotein YmbA